MHVERTAADVAWAAGLFEGEGWWGVRGKTSAEAVLGSTDLDVVERFAAIVGFGTISTELRADGHKTLYRWSASSAARVGSLIDLFWPWMGERRQRDAQAIRDATAACRGANATKTHCVHGHPYDAVNTRVMPNGDRRCKTCHRTHSAASAARRRAALNT